MSLEKFALKFKKIRVLTASLKLKESFILTWIILFLVCLAVRLPHLCSENSFIDEDEAIIGIMAQNLLDGAAFPYYFLGQNYGLSFFEVTAVALMEFINGSGVWTIRIGTLILFSLGITFIYLLVKDKTSNQKQAWVLAIFFSVFPSWYIFGMLARGGYVTGFVGSCILIFLLLKSTKSSWTDLWVGIFIFLIVESHTLFILQILPFVLFYYYRSLNKWRSIFLTTVTPVCLRIAVESLFVVPSLAELPKIDLTNVAYHNFAEHMNHFLNGFSGYYFFGVEFEIPIAWQIGIYLLLIFLLATIVRGFSCGNKAVKVTSALSVGAILFSFGLLSAIEGTAYRYMLAPLSGLLFLTLFMYVEVGFKNDRLFKSMIFIGLFGALFGGSISRHWYRDVNLEKSLRQVYASAKKRDVRAVVAVDNQYYWNYLFGKDIPAVNLCSKYRISSFAEKAKTEFVNNPQNVDIIGLYGIAYGMDHIEGFNDRMRQEAPGLFVHEGAKVDLINEAKKNYVCHELGTIF